MSRAAGWPLVTTPAGLAEVIAELADQPAYALDTEFHRERSYYARVALVQLAWEGGGALVDPLAVDLAPFAEVLDGPGRVSASSAKDITAGRYAEFEQRHREEEAERAALEEWDDLRELTAIERGRPDEDEDEP